jgi:hypothetical protein
VDKLKIIAMYLPQFHEVKENNEWWGDGFTEWTTVKAAKPLYENHNQPREPLYDNYYNLMDKQTMQWQSELMHKYNVDGLCFYHYWFKDGRQILEKPAENLLKWKEIDMPFCFAWANETWARSWSNVQGKNVWANTFEDKAKFEGNGILIEQAYGDETQWRKHFEYLLPFFQDKRYIRFNNMPVFVIYKSKMITCLKQMMNKWKQWAVESNLNGIYIIGANEDLVSEDALDAILYQEPQRTNGEVTVKRTKGKGFVIEDYDEVWDRILTRKYTSSKKIFKGGFVGYDDSPRRGQAGCIIENSTPEKFQYYITRLLAQNEAEEIELTFINAWNEWGEGMYLEPDKQYGFRYLEAIQKSVKDYQNYIEDYIKNKKIENDYNSEQNTHLQMRFMKYYRFTNILDNWLRIKEEGLSVESNLKARNIHTIAIYGIGMLGMHLMKELEDGNIIISYGIDRRSGAINVPYRLYTLDDNLPYVDMVIVTVFYEYDEIQRKLSSKGLKSISLENLILEL